jgi:hypothetical protein
MKCLEWKWRLFLGGSVTWTKTLWSVTSFTALSTTGNDRPTTLSGIPEHGLCFFFTRILPPPNAAEPHPDPAITSMESWGGDVERFMTRMTTRIRENYDRLTGGEWVECR